MAKKQTYARASPKVRTARSYPPKVGGTFRSLGARPGSYGQPNLLSLIGAGAAHFAEHGPRMRRKRTAKHYSRRSTDRVEGGKPTKSIVKTKDGISDVTMLKMSWTNTAAALAFGTYYMYANTIIDPDLGVDDTNFQYTRQWAGFYNYYEVEASSFKCVISNQDAQDKIIVVFPTIYPPGTGNVPLTLDAALIYPHAKHMYVGQDDSGVSINRITHYINIREFLADIVPFSTGTVDAMPSRAGRMPSVNFGGMGTQPTNSVWWCVQVYPTNNTDSGDIQADYQFELTDYVKMFGPVLQTDIDLLSKSPLWQKDHPDAVVLPDPLDPYYGGDPPPTQPRFQKIETKKYYDDLMASKKPFVPKDTTDPPVYPVPEEPAPAVPKAPAKAALKVRFPMLK